MSTDKARGKNTIWDIEFDKGVPDAALTAFNRHKKTFLVILRKAHKRGPKSKPFDANEAWRRLSHLAQLYFWDAKIKQEATPTAVRVKRLRQLAKALGQTRSIIDETMPDDISRDLVRACFGNDGSLDPMQLADARKKAVESLATLETAANRAAREVRTRGRPKGTGVLPPHYTVALAVLYRSRTGSKPDDCGPFVHLVREFLASIGQPKKATGDDISPYYAEETIKYARKRARKNPGVFALRPFDD